ncbi:PREDICTED: NADH dehydrogenase [ubiquinone] 1 alpha subcomplex subunit 11 [Polistes dominula]|uniref:NADH dehydrogenase [ubiquinone] 1 alpha subcomplex subunit 11 n=1 Tax=Polistes dominula TaxID=743375 RepID=A0ABM1JC11_POLDO|nr:PREDICTED: NADH dehydrogenase [ubiquinone] 1 alpha subcomplex subunit 11 [Polistes dominula]
MFGEFLRQFKYDHTTEGKEPFQKLLALGKYGYIGAVVSASYDLCVARPTPNRIEGFIRGGKHFLVWIGATSAFTLAVLALTNIRKKDDPWNYFYGTLAAGGVVYSLIPKGGTVGLITGYAALGAALYKYQLLQGYKPEKLKYVHTSMAFNFDKSPDVRYTKPDYSFYVK